MGELRHEASGRVVKLRADQLFGRAAGVDVRLDNPRVSAQHARLVCRRSRWELSDLGSRNGTFVESRRLGVGERPKLRKGDRVAFGDARDDAPVLNVSTGRLPETSEERPPVPTVDDIELRFSVSGDEEHVALTVVHSGGVVEVPVSSLHYLLLTLARQRLDDRRGRGSEDEEGWMYADVLCRALRLDPSHLNVSVFRVRKQLERLGVLGAARIVERRRTTAQLRIGVRDLSIKKL